jgi:UDP-2,4-diacetamido-2,4,6-trideoxy-beta-L-altropyranose hydrolase
MKVAIRADASLQIGTGHVLRCLTLAGALRENGAQCRFICREHSGNLIELIQERGFSVSVLPYFKETVISDEHIKTHQSYADWLSVDWDLDAEQTKLELAMEPVDLLIVDHYALDARWEKILQPMCRYLMVIDDLANRVHDCDLLLDQNLGSSQCDYGPLVPEGCCLLVGPHFTLLRSEFATIREESLLRRTNPQLNHLLIFMGGVDLVNATSKVLKVLKQSALPIDMRITVVMGMYAPWLEQVRSLAADMPVPTEVKCNIEDMALLMAYSDLAIGAAGSTSWERCCLGLPSMIVVLAENQVAIADALQAVGAAKIFVIDDKSNSLGALIHELLNSPTELSEMTRNAANVTDGFGTCRVVSTLVAKISEVQE